MARLTEEEKQAIAERLNEVGMNQTAKITIEVGGEVVCLESKDFILSCDDGILMRCTAAMIHGTIETLRDRLGSTIPEPIRQLFDALGGKANVLCNEPEVMAIQLNADNIEPETLIDKAVNRG